MHYLQRDKFGRFHDIDYSIHPHLRDHAEVPQKFVLVEVHTKPLVAIEGHAENVTVTVENLVNHMVTDNSSIHNDTIIHEKGSEIPTVTVLAIFVGGIFLGSFITYFL